MAPSKPQSIPTRPDAERPQPQLDAETQRTLEERLERDEPSEPWAAVKKRILERKPMP